VFALLFVFELLFELEFVAGFVAGFVAAALVAAALVALFVGVAVALLEAAGAVDGAAATAPVLIAPTPPKDMESLVENCGGVMDMTTPSPPSVPPAIRSPRFISSPFRKTSALTGLNPCAVLNR